MKVGQVVSLRGVIAHVSEDGFAVISVPDGRLITTSLGNLEPDDPRIDDKVTVLDRSDVGFIIDIHDSEWAQATVVWPDDTRTHEFLSELRVVV